MILTGSHRAVSHRAASHRDELSEVNQISHNVVFLSQPIHLVIFNGL